MLTRADKFHPRLAHFETEAESTRENRSSLCFPAVLIRTRLTFYLMKFTLSGTTCPDCGHGPVQFTVYAVDGYYRCPECRWAQEDHEYPVGIKD